MTRSASTTAAKRYYQGGVKVSIGGVPCRMARKPGEFYSKAVREGQHGFDKVSTAAVRQGEANYARECLEAMGLEVPEAPVRTSWYGAESKSKAWDAECVRAYLDALAAAGRPQVVTDVVDESEPMLDLETVEAPAVVKVAFVVYERQDGAAALCEGGVYSSAPQGEYAGNTIERAHADADTYNRRISRSNVCKGRYVVRSSLVGVDCADLEVLSSLEDWQKALIPDVTPVLEIVLDETGEVLATIGHSPTRGHVIAYQGREIETATMSAACEWLMATGDTRPVTMQAPRTIWAEAA